MIFKDYVEQGESDCTDPGMLSDGDGCISGDCGHGGAGQQAAEEYFLWGGGNDRHFPGRGNTAGSIPLRNDDHGMSALWL